MAINTNGTSQQTEFHPLCTAESAVTLVLNHASSSQIKVELDRFAPRSAPPRGSRRRPTDVTPVNLSTIAGPSGATG